MTRQWELEMRHNEGGVIQTIFNEWNRGPTAWISDSQPGSPVVRIHELDVLLPVTKEGEAREAKDGKASVNED